MNRGQWTVATLYKAGSGTRAVEKGYWHKTTAESHYNNMRGKPGIIELLLVSPEGRTVRSWNPARDEQ